MVLFVKSASCRRVSNEELNENNKYLEYYYNKGSSDDKNVDPSIILTVWRKSLLVSCSGFTVIDCKGNLVYRVDNYCGRPAEIVLMDASGHSLLTMRRHKKMTLGNDWGIYKGEESEPTKKKSHKKQAMIGYIKKNVTLLQGNSNVVAQVYIGPSSSSSSSSKKPTYVIQGSYNERCCKVFDKSSKTMVAEIKKKEAVNGGASFGLDVFHLVVVPGFDVGFAMALLLLLDQMYS